MQRYNKKQQGIAFFEKDYAKQGLSYMFKTAKRRKKHKKVKRREVIKTQLYSFLFIKLYFLSKKVFNYINNSYVLIT